MPQDRQPDFPWTDFKIAGLTPAKELAEMGDLQGKFHFNEACQYLVSHGLNPDNFYYNRSNPLTWFCYYHGMVWLEFPYFTRGGLQQFRVIDRIRLEEEALKACLQVKDYKSLFYMIHPHILLSAFVALSPEIPRDERYRLMGLIYARASRRLEQYPRDFVDSILKDRIDPWSITGADLSTNTVAIYYGQEPCGPPVENATSWTLDINTAIRRASRNGKRGMLCQGRVMQNHIVGLIKRCNEKEILVYPEHITGITPLHLPGYEEIRPVLEMTGIVSQYMQYGRLLQSSYFHRPNGIHGLNHTRRVLLLLLILAYHEHGTAALPAWLLLAALYHDIGRRNDNYDPSHGMASYEKAASLNLLLQEDEPYREMVRFVIENHCLDDDQAEARLKGYQIRNPEKCLDLFWLFKDADALDRIRINDLDVNHLRTEAAHELLWVARDLLDKPDILKNP